MTDFFDFLTDKNAIKVEIPEIIKIYMRNFYCKLSIDICTADVINGYGMQVLSVITVYRFEERCLKCGHSSIYKNTAYKECWGNCRWDKKYIPIWSDKLNGSTEEKLAESFEQFIVRSADKIYGHKAFAEDYTNKKARGEE